MAARHAGREATSLLSTYFACGDLDAAHRARSSPPACGSPAARTHDGTYRAPSVDAFVTTEVESTPLLERISDEVYRPHPRPTPTPSWHPSPPPMASVEAPFECNIVAARRP